jgi:hypothetical protein
MTKQIEDNDDRRRKMARDGERITVPLLMMDAAATARIDRIIKDAQTPNLLQRPGFVQLSDADRSNRDKIYGDHEKKLTERWKNQTPQLNPKDAVKSTGDARLNAYSYYEERLTNAWKHR